MAESAGREVTEQLPVPKPAVGLSGTVDSSQPLVIYNTTEKFLDGEQKMYMLSDQIVVVQNFESLNGPHLDA
ncbi:hypothetical protein RvY_13701 [Ramazzottius varieornatus]|uniref:Uncharacterized protein n=1 Tax=Ramazzottius varieornatus TaxID=947166 RepID=A0A1D1VXB0_RAMVA|nr:hypothetical protein RvY_13701 [Ramazzottius varieornatus]